jgi:hypothetical protein
METIGRQCAHAFERARLHEVEQRARGELARQKALLEAQSEASVEGILLVAPQGEIAAYNRRFVELWGIPEDVVEGRSDAEALKAVESKLVDPQAFYERVEYLFARPDEESRDEIELREGRIFDRFGAPVLGEDGTHYGRVWYFRDVTEQRRREEIGSFLAEASQILSSTMDYEAAIRRVVRLPIPRLVGVFTVSLLDETGALRLLAAAHADPGKERVLYEIARRFDSGAPSPPVRQVLESREPIRLDRVDEETLRPFATSDEHLRLLLEAFPAAGILVPSSRARTSTGRSVWERRPGGRPFRRGSGSSPRRSQGGSRSPSTTLACTGSSSDVRTLLGRSHMSPTRSCSSTATDASGTGIRRPARRSDSRPRRWVSAPRTSCRVGPSSRPNRGPRRKRRPGRPRSS